MKQAFLTVNENTCIAKSVYKMTLSGDVSAMSEESPYLIYYRPNKPLVENQAAFTGFPSYKTGTISSFSGYTLFLDAHIESVSCTSAERDEIMQLLKGGVII